MCETLVAPGLRSELEPLFDQFVLRAQAAAGEPGNMGDLEDGLAQDLREMQRVALERAAQAKADGADHSRCPVCSDKLERVSHGHERHVRTRFGLIALKRSKGFCRKCGQWRFPADDLLALDKHDPASPSVQRAESLLASKMPAEEAARVLRELTGMPADDSTVNRQGQRQGRRARELRRKMDEEACHTEGRWRVTEEVRKAMQPTPFTLVVEMDAWLIRERGGWGKTEELRAKDASFSHWKWVYAATVFRMDQRAETHGRRPLILSRGFVATRAGLDEFGRQVYAEAVRQGLLLAQDTLVIADGGVWIWNIADDRFPTARKRLDIMHANSHLWTIANELHGAGTEEARRWAEPLIHQLRHGGEGGVIRTLEDLAAAADPSGRPTLEREARYFASRKDQLDYAAGAAKGEPIGSGAIESTCRQYQCRFKRAGMFWSTEGDEDLLALETLWRNGRWNLLFPTKAQRAYARN